MGLTINDRNKVFEEFGYTPADEEIAMYYSYWRKDEKFLFCKTAGSSFQRLEMIDAIDLDEALKLHYLEPCHFYWETLAELRVLLKCFD